MNLIKWVIALFSIVFIVFLVHASGSVPESQGNGKIYVVLAVVLLTFAGLMFLLIRLDRNLSRIENQTSVPDESKLF